MNEELLSELTAKRDEIRERTAADGRRSPVCSDEAVSELVRLRPRTKEELTYVPGLGKVFAEKYGEEFLSILDSYREAEETDSERMLPAVRERLKNLENRLINVNRRNRLLYMPKISGKYALDLAAFDDGGYKVMQALISGDDSKIKIISSSNKEFLKRQTQFRILEREVERGRRERGEDTLYVGYPFVKGKMAGEDFDVYAPLVLFPVSLTVTENAVYLKLVKEKDVVYNTTLILSQYKFRGVNETAGDAEIEEIDPGKFIDDTLSYFARHGIKINKPRIKGIGKFSPAAAAEFKEFASGEFTLSENIVLGRFSLYSCALQQDFRRIIEADRINELLSGLLRSSDDEDMYGESEQAGDTPRITPPKEREITYINDLNGSQENALFNINASDRLVVQGPPGTGKSQLITSVIADFVRKGKKVLMVSQKKAALDVIYSRLGEASRYAVKIGDSKDKDSFYDSFAALFSDFPEPKFDEDRFAAVSERIDGGIARLNDIAEKLYYEQPYGTGMDVIYRETADNPFVRAASEKLQSFANNICLELSGLGYPDITEMSEYFDDKRLLEECKECYDLSDAFPWLEFMKEGLGGIELKQIEGEAEKLIDAYAEYKRYNVFKRLFLRGKYRKKVKAVCRLCFDTIDKRLVGQFAADPVDFYNGLKQYERYRELRLEMKGLGEKKKLYFGSLYNVMKARNEPLTELNRALRDYISYWYVCEFEKNNRSVLSGVETFDMTVRDLCRLFEEKRDAAKSGLLKTLKDAFAENILSAKKKNDMLRVATGKRRQSLAQFFTKYRFWLEKGIRIWLMTPQAVSEILPLEDGMFDLVIFDEASQVYVERGIPSIARAKKIIIAGDRKQLRPSSLGEGRIGPDEDDETDDAALEEESLLDLARFRFPEIMLDYHYRSRYEELIAFSDRAFYKGRLKMAPNLAPAPEPPITVHKVKNGVWEDKRNLREAKQTVGILTKYLLDPSRTSTLGVITFNSAQRDLVADLLDEECAKDSIFAAAYQREVDRTEGGEDVGLFVKNIENVQGDERDVIIFSVAYAKGANGKVVRNYGWLSSLGGENRLNVAISRAKEKIHLVTSITPDELVTDDLKNDGPKIFKKYLRYAYAVSDGDTARAKLVLDSFSAAKESREEENRFIGEVLEELKKEGLAAERGVGMGNYRPDIAVRDKSGRFVLGVDCDVSLYESRPSARERDLHRLRYLNSRGWKIYRIFSNKWWHDKDRQIKNIAALVRESESE